MHNIQARKIPRFYPRVCQTLKLHDYHEILAVSLTFHGNNKNCKIILLPFFVCFEWTPSMGWKVGIPRGILPQF